MAKRALLIGVNRYEVPGADLRGCVNDINNMKGMLVDRFDFPSARGRTLPDLKATKAKIEAGIVDVIYGADESLEEYGDELVVQIATDTVFGASFRAAPVLIRTRSRRGASRMARRRIFPPACDDGLGCRR